MMTVSAAITGLVVVFIVGVCFGACVMSLFAYKSYEKGVQDTLERMNQSGQSDIR